MNIVPPQFTRQFRRRLNAILEEFVALTAEPAAEAPRERWKGALSSEIEFWERWFATRGSEWPEDYQQRLDPETPLQDHLRALLAHVEAEEVSILDIGAGPLTKLGKKWPGRRVRIWAVDPLADAYDRIIDRHGATPPVRTTWCEGELVARRFPAETFDLVHAENSLDHSHDPVTIVEGALEVVKTGGNVVLWHERNEGVNESYGGLHQWNFCAEDGDFIVWNREGRENVSRRLSAHADVTCDERHGCISVVLKKRRPRI